METKNRRIKYVIRHVWLNIWHYKYSRIIIVVILSILSSYMFFFNFIGPTEVGIARNIISGETWIQDGNGFNLTAPWVYVPEIDTRPVKVEVTSAGHGFSAKLVQFNKTYWEEFVNTEGVYYYWWANRISFNLGYDEEHRGMKDILRGYAYSPKKYNFIILLDEYTEEY